MSRRTRNPKKPKRQPESAARRRAARSPGTTTPEANSLPAALQQAGNQALNQVLGGEEGQPLEPQTRAVMEHSFGADLSTVRVHEDATAQTASHLLHAAAFTQGEDIYLNANAPASTSPAGQTLLAHELAHVLQQRQARESQPMPVNAPGDAFEQDANRAATAVRTGQPAQLAANGATPAIQRQPLPDPVQTQPAVLQQQSPVEIAVLAYLNREWDAQSKREKPFRITPSVRQGLSVVFNETPAGIATIASPLQHDPGTPTVLMDSIRGQLPATISPGAFDLLSKMPAPATPQPEKIEGPQPSKEDEAHIAALKEALRRILETKAGQEVAQSAKRFVLSKEGIPLVVIVIGGVATFVAANDSQIPSVPDIPLGDGITLKIEIKGKPSDLPPLVRQMLGQEPTAGQPEPDEVRALRGDTSAKPDETRVGVSVTITNDKLVEFAQAIGRFFVLVGSGIAKGVVAAGKAIGAGVSAIWPYLGPALGGAAIGALIGGLAAGGLGAGIGALIGAGVGLLGALTAKFIDWLTKRKT